MATSFFLPNKNNCLIASFITGLTKALEVGKKLARSRSPLAKIFHFRASVQPLGFKPS